MVTLDVISLSKLICIHPMIWDQYMKEIFTIQLMIWNKLTIRLFTIQLRMSDQFNIRIFSCQLMIWRLIFRGSKIIVELPRRRSCDTILVCEVTRVGCVFCFIAVLVCQEDYIHILKCPCVAVYLVLDSTFSFGWFLAGKFKLMIVTVEHLLLSVLVLLCCP